MFLLILSFVAWAEVIGFWALLLIVAAVIPTFILNVQHHRQLQQDFR